MNNRFSLTRNYQSTLSLSYGDQIPNAVWIGKIHSRGFAELMCSQKSFLDTNSVIGKDLWSEYGFTKDRTEDNRFGFRDLASKMYKGYMSHPSEWTTNSERIRIRRDLTKTDSVDLRYSKFGETGMYVIVEYEDDDDSKSEYVMKLKTPFEQRSLRIQNLYGKCSYITYNGSPIEGSSFPWSVKIKEVTLMCMVDGFPVTVQNSTDIPAQLFFHLLKQHLVGQGIKRKSSVASWYMTNFDSWIHGFVSSVNMNSLYPLNIFSVDAWSELYAAA